MKTRLLLLAFSLLASFASFAQIDNHKGKPVLADGRKLSGTISYFYDSPQALTLYDSLNTKQVFTPAQLSEIILLDSRRFVVKDFNNEKIVLQLIIASDKMCLLKQDTELFILKEDKVHKLENYDSIIKEGGKTYKKSGKQYIGILTMLMDDRVDLYDEIQKLKLTEQNMVSLVSAYTNGNITYFHDSESRLQNDPFWAVFTQHSQYNFPEPINKNFYGLHVGMQYYFSSTKRSSVRLGLDYSEFDFKDVHAKVLTFALQYQYDFVKRENLNMYLAAALFSFGGAKVKDKENYSETTDYGAAIPLSLSLGLEYKVSNTFSVYTELNQLAKLKSLPKNYSLGVKYSFRK